jgi:hypothetical protein
VNILLRCSLGGLRRQCDGHPEEGQLL